VPASFSMLDSHVADGLARAELWPTRQARPHARPHILAPDTPDVSKGIRKRLVVEGWRRMAHSYAIVAQSHCLDLAARDDIDLRFVDLPYYSTTWHPTPGVFEPWQESLLAALREPEPGFAADATFTMRPEQPDFRSP